MLAACNRVSVSRKQSSRDPLTSLILSDREGIFSRVTLIHVVQLLQLLRQPFIRPTVLAPIIRLGAFELVRRAVRGLILTGGHQLSTLPLPTGH